MDLVLFSGYARMPSNTTAQRIYEEMALVALIDMDTGWFTMWSAPWSLAWPRNLSAISSSALI